MKRLDSQTTTLRTTFFCYVLFEDQRTWLTTVTYLAQSHRALVAKSGSEPPNARASESNLKAFFSHFRAYWRMEY